MAEGLAHFASHSHLISLGLARARDIDAIAEAASGMTRLVRSLNDNGTRIPYMMELVSALNRHIMGRIFELVVPVELRDRVCLLALGTAGRSVRLPTTAPDKAQ